MYLQSIFQYWMDGSKNLLLQRTYASGLDKLLCDPVKRERERERERERTMQIKQKNIVLIK